MSDEGKKLQTLLTVPSQAEAKLIVAALADYGIKARSSEASADGSPSPAPVQVAVAGDDAEQAVGAIQDMRSTHQEIDWSHVDVGPAGGRFA
ncbi:hypothetical protein Mal4_43850 [Maioricimonas rarisocia]|uniref:DUF2007 domain-containing protein n=1 Tax=Maioricimonas rarisocia TaxID=2528026 RepID=A0A517ZC56_9PLAN|nr:hypothetical protein [Maioricimonas rarisocia]QDU40031.1 hypothetical protein Mal4_43850 [Maioricimonas rarisocia]